MGLMGKRKNRQRRHEFHQTSPARRRAEKRTTTELVSWAEAMTMNQNYWISHYITTGEPQCIDEAIFHNDALCAILLELQTRIGLGVA